METKHMAESNTAASIQNTMNLLRSWGMFDGKTKNEIETICGRLHEIADSAIHDMRMKCQDVFLDSRKELKEIPTKMYNTQPVVR